MSQENVEVVQRAYETWNAGDMNALCELYAPDAMIVRGLEVGRRQERSLVGRRS